MPGWPVIVPEVHRCGQQLEPKCGKSIKCKEEG